ncbi:MAG: leucine-rich repeat domain-containing protein, partial [Bacteroidaceae bacterium]|nr:leucine-rich repeat domain-containing protein [Bacteroidaceae bacterium]
SSALGTVGLAEGLASIKTCAFKHCGNLKELVCPSTLTSIEAYAFEDCTSLSVVSLNEGLTHLDTHAFGSCKALKEITLPSTLTDCDQPFYYCDNLKKVTCLALVPPMDVDGSDYPFYGVNMENRALYVPAWTLNKYKLTKGWDQFSIIEPLEGYWPENIVLIDEFVLTLPDTLPVEYKPNLSMKHTDNNSYSRYDWTYGMLSVNGNQTLSIGTLSMVYDQNMFYDYGRNYSPWYTTLVNNATMRADSICIKMYLRNDRWAFVSFPFDVKVSDVQDILGNTNFVIRKYSGKERAEANFVNTWQDMTVDSVLRAGEGYIWQCSRYDNDGYHKDYSGFKVSAINNVNKNLIFANDTRTVALNEYQAEFSHNRSWNLIGNPFPCYYDTRVIEFTAPITVWNENNNTYNAYSPMDDAYILRPGEAFFVQCPIDKESISFPTDGRQTSWEVKDRSTYNGARSVSAPRQVFNLLLNCGEMSDRTRFVINADAEMGYDMSRDASKFMSSDSRVPQLFTVEGDVHFAINERPMGNGVIALGAYFGSEGTYTLALDTEVQTEVMLVDKLTGKEVNLAAADYTFSAEAGTVTDRFEIKFGGATSVEENLAQQVSVQAVGGQIIVNGAEGTEAVVYTADGKQIAAVQGNAALDVNPGLYIVKAQGKSYKVSVVR